MVESHKSASATSRLRRAIKSVFVRVYAFGILLVVLWAGYTAVAYLMRTVFQPVHVPERFVERTSTFEASLLHEGQVRAAQLAAARPPIGRYHEVGRWIQPDNHNGCVTSGCHGPLPHAARKEVRAFANFHTTFVSCGLCHDAGLQPPVPAAWVDIGTAQRQDPPALLQLIRLLELQHEKIQSQPADVHPDIVRLLRQANAISQDELLGRLLVQLDTAEPGSPVWRRAVADLGVELPNHARGEYGARIAAESRIAQLPEQARRLEAAAKTYLAAREGSPERLQLHKQIHENVLAKPEACLSCHGGEPERLNYEALGYSPQRIAGLRSSPIVRLIQQIREGTPFYLPQLLEGGNAP